MASNFTEHFQLNQWQPGDQVLREDFNEDNAKIDGALKTLEDAAATIPKMAAGKYIGDGSNEAKSLALPFEAKLLVITSYRGTGYFVRDGFGVSNMFSGPNYNYLLSVTWDGCTVTWIKAGDTGGNATFQLNASGVHYTYFALG